MRGLLSVVGQHLVQIVSKKQSRGAVRQLRRCQASGVVISRGLMAQCCNKPEGCIHQSPKERLEQHPAGPEAHKRATSPVVEEHSPCWACGKPTGCCNFFCVCGKIQPLVGHCSYFETFHMPKRYDIDTKRLEAEYWKLQKSLHPDLFGSKSRAEQDLSKNNSTYLNVAYRTLRDPTLRAKYLLQLEGIRTLDEDSKTGDMGLIMEIMELRESIEECTSLDEITDIIRRNKQNVEVVKAALAQAYQAKDLEHMAALTNRLQYLSKANYEAREKRDQLEDAAAAASRTQRQQQQQQ